MTATPRFRVAAVGVLPPPLADSSIAVERFGGADAFAADGPDADLVIAAFPAYHAVLQTVMIRSSHPPVIVVCGRQVSARQAVQCLRDGASQVLFEDELPDPRWWTRAPEHVPGESRFRELLEAAPDAILEVEREGRIVLVNAAAEKLFGYSRSELLNRSVEDLLPESFRAAHRVHRSRYSDHPLTRPMGSGLDLLAQRNDGSQFPVEISLSPILTADGHRVTAVIRDVSERKQAERQLRVMQERYTAELASKNEELELRNREVERANRLKSEFLASMSHELRTPLHTIIGFSELLLEQIDGPLNDSQRRFLSHIQADSRHLLELINDILDLSKIEAGRLELRREVFDMSAALAEVLASIQPLALSKSLSLENHVAGTFDLFADRVRFKEILYNLLSNAVKFTPEGGRIWVELISARDGLGMSVNDTGIGIPVEEHGSIFDKFHQVGATTKGVREGTGLGLAITRKLVELHGGRIWFESVPGKGSRFSFILPAELSAVEST